jgi:hypothetical protein
MLVQYTSEKFVVAKCITVKFCIIAKTSKIESPSRVLQHLDSEAQQAAATHTYTNNSWTLSHSSQHSNLFLLFAYSKF